MVESKWKKELNEMRLIEKGEMAVRTHLAIEKFISLQLQRERGKWLKIVRWLLGYTDFPSRDLGEGAYYWRTHLRRKLRAMRVSKYDIDPQITKDIKS